MTETTPTDDSTDTRPPATITGEDVTRVATANGEALRSTIIEQTLVETTPSVRVDITAPGDKEATFDDIRDAVGDVLGGGDA